MNKKNITLIIFSFLIVVAIFSLIMINASKNTEFLQGVSECVAKTAKEENYKGNIYGEEAWRIFADVCTK